MAQHTPSPRSAGQEQTREELTPREQAVQAALKKVADKQPLKASKDAAKRPMVMSASLGDKVPFLEQSLVTVVGDKTAANLKKLQLETVGDLLWHFPRRYGDPGKLTDMSALVDGEHVTVVAEIVSATTRPMSSRAGYMLQATVTDGRNQLGLTFFAKKQNSLYYAGKKLASGKVGLFTGVVSTYRDQRQLTHPDYLIVGEDTQSEAEAIAEASKPIPIYAATAKLATWRIATAVKTILAQLQEQDIKDPVPQEVLKKHNLVSLFQALHDIHTPEDPGQWQRGQDRMRFEEAFIVQSALVQRRAENEQLTATSHPVPTGPSILSAFESRLPFTLTAGQLEVGEQISNDLARNFPMQRLLQGDVGSGKTVVALRAMLQVIATGGQAALLAPTEVLAAQHAASITTLLGELSQAGTLEGAEFATRVTLLTGSMSAPEKRKALGLAASGAAGIVVGTHALLSDHVQFADLDLVVVDEQHRFGVEQRDSLRAKGANVPHLLVMTATPIPRTVAMTVFGDLETSTLTEMPAGRAGIDTFIVPAEKPNWMTRTWQRAREEIAAGRQVYVVCSRISASQEEPEPRASVPDQGMISEGLDHLFEFEEEVAPDRQLYSVQDVAQFLATNPVFAGVTIGVLHGQLPPAEKEATMADFSSGKTQLLVSTTVIEVGVDVSAASVMIVLDADRFGISQLHQLRGRIGRGTDRGICLLVAPTIVEGPAHGRLEALVRTTDGFELANADLELRSEGDVLGAAQSGRGSSLRMLQVFRDAELLMTAREDAQELLAQDPTLSQSPNLASAIAKRLGPDRVKFLDRS